MTSTSGGNGMPIKDWIGILFSATALLVSFAGFYIANMQVKDEVNVRISDLQVDPGTPDDHINGYRNDYVVAKASFINAGNRDAVIDKPTFQISHKPNLDDGGFGSEVTAGPDDFPFVLEPKKIRVVSLKIPVRTFLNNLQHGAPAPVGRAASDSPSLVVEGNEERKDRRLFFAGFVYAAIDSEGVPHQAWSGMQMQIEASPGGWARLGPWPERGRGKGPQFLATALF